MLPFAERNDIKTLGPVSGDPGFFGPAPAPNRVADKANKVWCITYITIHNVYSVYLLIWRVSGAGYL
jgi:hypothetical protein